MSISIKITNTSEAEELSQIQKAAFKPLYEKFHDAGNPFLRGSEDILRRLNKCNKNRYYRRKHRFEELVHSEWICSYRNKEV